MPNLEPSPLQTDTSHTHWGAYLLGSIELPLAILILFGAGAIFVAQVHHAAAADLFATAAFTLTGVSMAFAAITLLGHRKFLFVTVRRARWCALAGQAVAASAGVVELLYGGSGSADFRGAAALVGLEILALTLLLFLFSLSSLWYIRRLRSA